MHACIAANVDVNEERMGRFGSIARTALMLAAIGNHADVSRGWFWPNEKILLYNMY
jgi:hypothetical protein